MNHQELEIFSLNIKTNLDINVVKNTSIQWLKKISAKIENISSNYISARHVILYPSYLSKIKFKHIDPSCWEKRIELNYTEEIRGVTINITFFSLNKNDIEKTSLKKWWLYWVYDLTEYLGINVSLPSYTLNDIKTMQKEVIYNSKYLIALVFLNVIIGLFFFKSSLDVMIRSIIGLLYMTSALLASYNVIKTYNKINKKLFKYQIK